MTEAPPSLHPLLRERRSPRAFASRLVSDEERLRLFEAARWAPSCFNEQPWRFLTALRQHEAEFARLLSCLAEANQLWAKHAGLLIVTVASQAFARNGKPNRFAAHDVGLAIGQLTVQASSMGLIVHQMGGFSPERVRELYAVPDDFEPVTAVAVGYPGVASDLPENLRARELEPRVRRPLASMLFQGGWDQPPPSTAD
ncbi:MAG: nitroreductase family protein [Myxococcales bacterium FL481]|nr:MAG: nitroreductase family protein [Myxococcales bacterium FL481]